MVIHYMLIDTSFVFVTIYAWLMVIRNFVGEMRRNLILHRTRVWIRRKNFLLEGVIQYHLLV